jgi:hypothetical protein
MTTMDASVRLQADVNLAIKQATPQIAAGILANLLNPLNVGPWAHAKLPAAYVIRFGTLDDPFGPGQNKLTEQSTYTAQTTGEHTANVDLGDGYRLEVDERNSEMMIINENTGQKTKIWGDPHVEVDGKHQFDFYGTSTFELDNGTKITINTEQWAGNPNAYVASKVTVTKGSNAVVIDGISQNQLGDLKVSLSNNGEFLDMATRDGFTMHEGQNGWTTELGTKVTQSDADLTKPGELYGPGSLEPSLGELGQAIGSFLLLGFAAQLGAAVATRSATESVAASILYRNLLLA